MFAKIFPRRAYSSDRVAGPPYPTINENLATISLPEKGGQNSLVWCIGKTFIYTYFSVFRRTGYILAYLLSEMKEECSLIGSGLGSIAKK